MPLRLLCLLVALSLCCAGRVGAQSPGVPNGITSVFLNVIGWIGPSIAANTTNYIAVSGSGVNQNTGTILSRAGTFKNMYIRSTFAPSTGQNYVFTLYVGTAGSMSATSVACTISDANQTCTDTSHTAAITPGQSYAIQVVTSTTAAATGIIQIGLELDAQ